MKSISKMQIQRYRDRKRPMRRKLTIAVMAENIYKSLSDKLILEQQNYKPEVESKEEQGELF